MFNSNECSPKVWPVMDSQLTKELWDENPDAILAIAPDGSILHWNRAAEAIFGYSRAEALGKPIADLILPEDHVEEDLRAQADAFLRDIAIYESVRRRKDGALVHVSVSSKALKDAEGRLRFIVSTLKDVTHLKVMRDAKLVEAKFRDLLEFIPDAIVMANATGRIVLVNSQAERVFGQKRSDLIGVPVDMLLPVRFRSTHNADGSSFFNQPRSRLADLSTELYGLRSDGEEFPIEISLSPLFTEEGTMVMSTVRDITERKRAEQKFRGLLESAPDAMLIVARDGRITLANSKLERLFGYGKGELLNRPIEMLVPRGFYDKPPAHRSHFLPQPRSRTMGEGLALHGSRKDGSQFPIEISLSPIETEEGLFVASAIRDATERRRNEQALQEANRLKSVFLANMSHELRTPLNGIIRLAEFLIEEKSGPLNHKQQEYLGDVLNSGRDLLHLIDDVLDLSKLEAGKMQLRPEVFSVAGAIEEVCSVLFPIAQKKYITIRRHVAEEVSAVHLDRPKFVQVLYDLLSNAVKSNDERGEVAVLVQLESPDCLLLQVRDGGIGIDGADFNRIGLALTKKIIEFQGGRIDVVSQLDKGSHFNVHLPFTLAEAAAAGAAAAV